MLGFGFQTPEVAAALTKGVPASVLLVDGQPLVVDGQYIEVSRDD